MPKMKPEAPTATKPLYVEFHVLRSYPPSNLNRDDLGSPKSIVFGGVRRVRVSSQCLKRTWRKSSYFRDEFDEKDLGTRTKKLADLVGKALGEEFDKDARKGLDHVFAVLGRAKGAEASSKKSAVAKESDDDEQSHEAAHVRDEDANDESEETAHLLFLSQGEVEAVAEFARTNRKDLGDLATKVAEEEAKKGAETAAKRAAARAAKDRGEQIAGKQRGAPKGKAESTALLSKLRDTLGRYLEETIKRSAVDVALFGRFLTSDEFRECNAAMQVAHALGTQKLDLEYDYFTAVDDLQPEGEPGASHLGETELCSSVLYEYAVCEMGALVENLGDDDNGKRLAAKAMRAIAFAMCRSIFEKAKRNGTAPHTPADFLEVVVRRDAPVSLANAFLTPVRPEGGGDVMERSISALRKQATKYDEAYGQENLERFRLCLREVQGAESTKPSLAELAQSIETKLRAELGVS